MAITGGTRVVEKPERQKKGPRITRRSFMTKGAIAGAAATALYVAPQFTTTLAQRAYAGFTGPGDICIPTWCVRKGGITSTATPQTVEPIDYPGTIAEWYSYGSPHGSSANTPGVNLDISGFEALVGLEEIRFTSDGKLHGDIMMFALIRTWDNSGSPKQVHLVTLLDSPDENSGTVRSSHFAGAGNEGGHARISYSGLPTGTFWSVEDDPPEAPGHTIPSAGTALMDVTWIDCCTDGGALTAPSSAPFDCDSKICVDIQSSINSNGSVASDGIGPVCFAYQKTRFVDGWVPNHNGEGVAQPKAPVIRLREVNGDFCLSGDWDWA